MVQEKTKKKKDRKCLKCFWTELFRDGEEGKYFPDTHEITRHGFHDVSFLVIREESGIRLDRVASYKWNIICNGNYIGMIVLRHKLKR